MQQEINDLIEKSLPEQVGKTLKIRLQKAEEDAQSIISLTDQINKKDAYIRQLEKSAKDQKSMDDDALKLKAMKEEIDKKINDYEITKLKHELAESEKRADLISSYTYGLVRNTSFRKNIFDSENQEPYQDSNGNYHYPGPKSKHYSETKEAE